MRQIAMLLAGTLALASCGDAEPVDEIEPTPVPSESLPADVVDERLSPPDAGAAPGGNDALAEGQWYAKTERGVQMAMFGPPDSEVLFSVRCEGNELAFGLGVGRASGPATIEIAAGGETRRIAATAQQDPIPHASGRIPADDPFAAVLAEATGPIAVTIDGDPALRVPAHESMRQVVADCPG